MGKYINFKQIDFRHLSVIVLLCVLIPGIAVQASDVSVKKTPLKIAEPGELVTHVFTVKNEGASSDTYRLTLDIPDDWSNLPIPDQVSLSAGASRPVFVNINVPASAKAGKYEITLSAESETGPEKASTTTHIQVKSVPGFELTWVEEPPRLGPGAEGKGRLRIANTGNLIDSYEIEVEVEENWDYSLEKEKVQLLPGQAKVLEITVVAPSGATTDERYRIELTVTSIKRPELEKKLTSFGNIAPPPPEKVPDDLYPTWDATFEATINQNGDPDFLFSGRGDIRHVGEVSASLSLGVDGFEDANLQVMKDNWGFTLDGASISGSYLSISGSPIFIGERDNSFSRIIFSEESKGVSIDREGEYWNLRAVLLNDGVDDVAMAELQGVYEFSTGQTLDGLITTARSGNERGTIIEAGLELSTEKIEIYPSFIRVFSGYPNQLPSRSYTIDLNWEEQEFSSSFNWSHSRTKIGEGANSYHTAENSFIGSISLDFGENLDSNFSLSWTDRTSDDEPQSNDLESRVFSGSFSGGEQIDWSLGGSFTNTVDEVSETEINVESLNASISFELEETEHTISTSFSRTTGTVYDDFSNTFSLTSSFPEAPLSPTFSISRGSSDTTARVNVYETGGRDLSVDLGFSLSLVQQDSFSVSFAADFPGLFRFAGPTKGQVTGRLFVDENGNGRQDPGEEGVEDVLLLLNEEKAISGSDGKFAFPPVFPGEYSLKIEEIRSGLKPAVDTPISVRVKRGQRPLVKIPLRPRSWISGLVFNDENENAQRDQGEGGLAGIRLSIVGQGLEKVISSGPSGRFTTDLTPGNYRVKLQEESLPERFKPTTPATVTVNAEEYGRTEVKFGVYQKPKPVKVTFGPPTARFSYTPENPGVDTVILLNGSESSAIQTEIVAYEWKLAHGKREITKSGEKVRVSLPEAGDWEVSLTVTDKNGLKNKTVKTISVSQQ